MSGTGSNDGNHDELRILAGEYVLGLLSEDERAAFEARLASEPSTRAFVADWRERLLELDLSAAPVTPSPDLWPGIERRIEASARVHEFRPRASARQTIAPQPTRRAFWQGFAAASVFATIGGGIGLYQIARQKPRLIVVLLDAAAEPVSIVEAYEGQRIRVVPLTGIPVPEGKTLQVWTLPSRERGPVSMGLLVGSSAATLVGPELPEPKPEQLYEITVEPAGGSPTGRPTGPIVGKGFAKLPQI